MTRQKREEQHIDGKVSAVFTSGAKGPAMSQQRLPAVTAWTALFLFAAITQSTGPSVGLLADEEVQTPVFDIGYGSVMAVDGVFRGFDHFPNDIGPLTTVPFVRQCRS